MKVQDVFGNVIGFMEFIILIISLINIYTNYRYEYYLFYEHVNIKIEDKRNSKNKIDINMKNKSSQYNSKNKNIEIANINSNINVDFNIINTEKTKNPLGKITIEQPCTINNIKFYREKNDINQMSLASQPISQIRLVNYDAISPPENLFESNINNDNYNKIISEKIVKESVKTDNKNMKSLLNDLNIKKRLSLELNSNLEVKKRYLIPNFFNYYFECCVNSFKYSKNANDLNKKKLLELRLLKTFIEKINKKFDIFNYLKRIKEVKNLEEYVFNNEKNLLVFKILSKNFYDLKIEAEYKMNSSDKAKKNEQILKEWIESQNLNSNEAFFDFVIRKLNCEA